VNGGAPLARFRGQLEAIVIQLFIHSLLLLTLADYPKPDLLVAAETFIKQPTGLVLDVRSRQNYLAGHIPGAVSVNAAGWGKAFTPTASDDEWAKRLGQAGIQPDKTVILCGGDDPREATRIWWILHYWGIRDVRILNGGWPAWQSAGGPRSTDETKATATHPKLTPNKLVLAQKDEIVALLKGVAAQILDTRSTAEYCGDTTMAKRNGAIPGAIHLEWLECIDPKTKKFKSAAELQKILQDHHIDPTKPAITYCQSGGRASVVAFTLELMGGTEIKNYYRSWAEWGNDESTPITKPQKNK
jgi:thiosulfate/3-mercaptopyruvate sulfurtransferase